MPYFITDRHPECSNWALVKEDGELVYCHRNKEAATNHMIAISLSEELDPGGEYDGESFRALPDAYRPANSEGVPEGRACGNCFFYQEDKQNEEGLSYCSKWDDYVRGDYYCNAWRANSSYRNDEEQGTPAPLEDQIEGSDTNEPGSASGAGGDIELSERTEAALRNKVREHNEAMEAEGKPDWARTTFGQLAAVYRRGAGAYSTSHRPGVSRAAWAMARVNAYLYLLRNGEPQDSKYITDNDLLPEDHPESTRSFEFRDVDLTPPAYMRAAARRGLEFYGEGLAGDGVTEQTIREARAMAQGNVTADKYKRIAAWIARHLVDLEAPQNRPSNDDFPGAGAVAFYLWGAVPTPRGAERTRAYAEGITSRIEAENEGRAKGEALGKLETRNTLTDFEIREEGDGMRFSGYAAVFNEPSQPLPFTERIAPGAFRRSLRARNDIKLLWNHDTGTVLGSSRAGTLSLVEDAKGLKVDALLPNTTAGRDASELLKRGDVDGMSFGFSVVKDEWSADGNERTLQSVRLHEVSITPFPAYTQTSGTASVRGLDKIAKRAEVDADALADALIKLETGEEISPEDVEMLDSVIKSLTPVSEEAPAEEVTPDEPEDEGKAILELKKKKLAALMKAI